MSTRFKRVYCQCGEPVKGEPVYCRHCGRKLGEAEPDDLEAITGAVRDFTDTASDAKKEAKYNQQQWSLFETNYQREKGISTEESMREIEEFSRDGIMPEPAPRKNPANVGGDFFRGDLTVAIEKGEEKRKKKLGIVKRLSGRLSLGRSSDAGGDGAHRGGPGPSFGPVSDDSANKLADQSNKSGAAFFATYMNNEKKKFQPQYL